jgi:hypothetical protein
MRLNVLAVTISVFVLLAPCVRAQGPETSSRLAALPEMPTPKPVAAGCSGLRSACLHPKRDGNGLRLQQSSRQSRVADKKFWAVAGSTIGTSLLMTAAVSHCRRTVGVESCLGGYGPFKARQGVLIGVSGFMTGLGYFWKKSEQENGDKHRQWWVFPVGITAFNTFVAVDQYHKHCPRGTRFDGDSCS